MLLVPKTMNLVRQAFGNEIHGRIKQDEVTEVLSGVP